MKKYKKLLEYEKENHLTVEGERLDYQSKNRKGVTLENYLNRAGFNISDAPLHRLSNSEMKQYPLTKKILDWEINLPS